jgi:hypothetical protein
MAIIEAVCEILALADVHRAIVNRDDVDAGSSVGRPINGEPAERSRPVWVESSSGRLRIPALGHELKWGTVGPALAVEVGDPPKYEAAPLPCLNHRWMVCERSLRRPMDEVHSLVHQIDDFSR